MTTKVSRRALQGVAAAPGTARGPWLLVARRELDPPRQIAAEEAGAEISRLRGAADAVADASEALALDVAASGAEEESGIFAAQAEMARDPGLIDVAADQIRSRLVDAVGGITAAAELAAETLRGLDDELLRARAADVLDVGDRIARQLAGLPATEVVLAAPAVVVATDLSPSVTATMARDRLLGIALEGSSPTAHVAILARAYGIPAVVGVPGLVGAVGEAAGVDDLMLDGTSGEVVIGPDPDDLERLEALQSVSRAARARDIEDAALPAETHDGTVVTLQANVVVPADAPAAVELGARGVGLLRTEFLFLERPRPPSEDEQAEAYGAVVAAFAPHPVTIRLLDVGGDKPIPYLPMPREDNPFLGVRALRLAAERPQLFVTQLRACHRAASRGTVKVMAPMVADAADVATLLELAAEARNGLVADGAVFGEIELGVMLEIPSAVLTADSFLDQLSFASLGTNDLAQYALAADRGNPALERYRDGLHPGVLRLIRMAVASASRAGADLSVCGEMAGDPVAALVLVGLGIRSLSMGSSSLAPVRRAIRGASLEILETAALAALDDASAPDVRRRFTDLA